MMKKFRNIYANFMGQCPTDLKQSGAFGKVMIKAQTKDWTSSPTRYIFLAHRIRLSEILPWDRKSYLTHAILPRMSSNVIM